MTPEEYDALVPGDFVTYLGPVTGSHAMRPGAVAQIVSTSPSEYRMDPMARKWIKLPAKIQFVETPQRRGQRDGIYDMAEFRSPYRTVFTTVDQADAWLDANTPTLES